MIFHYNIFFFLWQGITMDTDQIRLFVYRFFITIFFSMAGANNGHGPVSGSRRRFTLVKIQEDLHCNEPERGGVAAGVLLVGDLRRQSHDLFCDGAGQKPSPP